MVIAMVVLNKSLTGPRSPLQKQQSQRSRRARICFHDALTHSFGLTCPRLIAILDPSSYLAFPVLPLPFFFPSPLALLTANLDEAYSCRSQTQAVTTSVLLLLPLIDVLISIARTHTQRLSDRNRLLALALCRLHSHSKLDSNQKKISLAEEKEENDRETDKDSELKLVPAQSPDRRKKMETKETNETSA